MMTLSDALSYTAAMLAEDAEISRIVQEILVEGRWAEAIESERKATVVQDPMSKILLPRPRAGRGSIREQLLNDIEDSLQTYLRTNQKPHYSLEQMAVIAVAFSGSCCTQKQALAWLIKNIPYYNQLVREEYVSEGYSEPFRNLFEAVFYGLEVPIMPAQIKRDPREWRTFSTTNRTYLGLQQRTRPEQPFRFFDLPAELRERIYGLAFAAPNDQIMITRLPPRTISYKQRRCYDRPRLYGFPGASKRPLADWMFELNPLATGRSNRKFHFHEGQQLSEHLAPMVVNKQFYQEAIPVFYRETNFICPSMGYLKELLHWTPIEHRQSIRHLAFFMNPREGRREQSPLSSEFPACYEMMQGMESLQTLSIFMVEKSWSEVKKVKGQQKWPDLLKIPAVKQLSQLRGLKRVTFHGDCPTVEAALGPLMVQPKVEIPVRKRKSPKQEDVDGTKVAGGPKPKKAKKSAAT